MIDLQWVGDYIDLSDQDLNELAKKITKAGINIEKVISNHIDNLVIGKVIKCKEHPDSDHLHVCTVDVGDEKLQIVCGAPNVKENMKVIVALPKAILPGDFEIKKSKIRGVESNGMLCALFELGLEEKTEENYSKGIEEIDQNAPVGMDALKYLGLDDTLYELDIHKHRNNDCYYHIGFAYEISAILNRKVKLPVDNYKEIKDDVCDEVKLEVKTDKCPYYLAKEVKDVKIGESPEFIKRRLKSYGMRSINNVVDISNYVMLEYGQPLHFFDKEKLGDKIVVRTAKENEKITTLDEEERILTPNDIIITDGKKPIAIAGVMGGLNTDVDENTKSIIVESAIFDSVSVRNTSSRLNLKSESSIRFGKGLSYEYTNKAIDRACHLLEKYASGKVLSNTVKHDKIDKKEKKFTFKTEQINDILGIVLTDDDVKKELEKLDFPYEYKDKLFTVTIPLRRLDIDCNVNDIAEEIGRLYGYNNLNSTLPKLSTRKGEYIGDVKYRKTISKRLRNLGLNECKTYTLISPDMAKMFKYESKENVILPNPMSIDKSVVRTSLIPSLLNVYNYNKSRQVEDVMIYEISKTYDKKYTEESKVTCLMRGNYISSSFEKIVMPVNFYVVKGILCSLLDYLGFKNRYTFERLDNKDMHPGMSASVLLDRKQIGIIGRVHPSIIKDDVYVFEISLNSLMTKTKPIKYKAASKYPQVVKDVSFVVDGTVTNEEIIKVIKKAGGRLLKGARVFDLYRGEGIGIGKKSISYSLTFSSDDRTLSEKEVMELFENIINNVKDKVNAIVRDR
ncbi:MAG: phenylalanine--tRNA ligase subunit beta [Bacilli bacterium]|nr:phenylalanine--tRNA ligase subunit beta [Bacilli bacterium]